MSALFFDQFSDEPVLIKPYESIGDDVVLAYDRDALKNNALISAVFGD